MFVFVMFEHEDDDKAFFFGVLLVIWISFDDGTGGTVAHDGVFVVLLLLLVFHPETMMREFSLACWSSGLVLGIGMVALWLMMGCLLFCCCC